MKRIKNKRGIALENAILFMIVIFSLCFLLTSLTLIGHYQVKIENILLTKRVDIDQIGENFLMSISRGESLPENYGDYNCETSETEGIYTLTVKNKNTPVLYVEAELVGGKAEVLSWRYSIPEE